MARRKRSPWVWVGIAAGCVLLVGIVLFDGYTLLVGWPTTPMTVERLERLAHEGVRVGQTREEVEAWLAGLGVPWGLSFHDTHYHVLVRDEHDPKWSIEGSGNQSVAERAGLDPGAVHAYIRVMYPDARRCLAWRQEIRLYLFFDKDDRLLRWSVEERGIGL